MFTIEHEVKQAGFRNRYVLEVRGTFVNAPGDAVIEMGGFVPHTDDNHLSDLMDTVKRLIAAYGASREATDDYFHIDGYEKWFAPSAFSESERAELPATVREHARDWLADPSGLPGARATFSTCQLYFYDQEGTKFTVAYSPSKMRQVSSSMIDSIGYDEKGKKLRIAFLKGGTYVYYNVQRDVYIEMMNADSIGRYFLQNVKPHYEFDKE